MAASSTHRFESLENRRLMTACADLQCSEQQLIAAIEERAPDMDWNQDAAVDGADIRFVVEQLLESRLGDANLDRRVDFHDFTVLAEHFGVTDARYAEGDFDGDGTVGFLDFTLLSSSFGFIGAGRQLPPADGVTRIANRKIFDAIAHTEDVPGTAGIPEVKFIVELADDEVTFLNHHQFDLHYTFASRALHYPGSVFEFNRETYFTDQRRFLAGSILAHDNFQEDTRQGMYTVEFWPTDPVPASLVIEAMVALGDALPFAREQLAYHPSGETQRALFDQDASLFTASGTETISTERLFGNQTYATLNPGLAFGRLRTVDGSDAVPLTNRDIVIFENIPNDLTHVAGVITVQPQTPLSHVNLRAKQNDTPNAYLRDALRLPLITDLIGKLVRFEAFEDQYRIREATAAEVEIHFASIRPTESQYPRRDLTVTQVTSLASLRNADQTAFGAKAANLGELASILPDEQVPDGLAIPFSYYDKFMRENGLYERVRQIMQTPGFETDGELRERLLDGFRKEVRAAPTNAEASTTFAAAHEALKSHFGDEATFRLRSSTNNEDLEGFSGAGLYRSYTHRLHEGKLENSIRQVWSSLWTFRAFEERTFWRIDHFSAAMGVAIHPNFDFEQVNGVAITKNIYDPFREGYYVNAQVGEDLVTNPEPGAVPDEFLISAIGPQREWEVQFLRRSNLTKDSQPVIQSAHITELREAMRRIQQHFRQVYEAENDPSFAMDIEFKVDALGQLVIKQARPWVD